MYKKISIIFLLITFSSIAIANSKIEIRIMAHQELRLKVLRDLEPIIENRLSNVDFQIEVGPDRGGAYDTKLIAALRGGVAADIFHVGDSAASEIVSSGFSLDLTNRVQNWSGWNQFYDIAKSDMKKIGKGKVHSLPYTASAMSIWYRKDLLKEAGVSQAQPKTWKELLEKARTVRQKSRAKYALMFPMGAIWGGGPWGEGFKHMLLASSVPRIIDSQGRVIAQSKGLLEVFKFYEVLVKENMFQIDAMLAPLPHVIPKYQQFPAAELAMETQGTWGWRFDYGPEGATPIPNITDVVGTWAFPTIDGNREPIVVGSTGPVFMINGNTKHPKESWEVLKIITSAEGIGRFGLSVGAIAPRKDARKAFLPYAENKQLLEDEDRLANLVNIPPFSGQRSVVLAVATATEHLLLGRSAEQAMTTYTNMIKQAFRKKKDKIVVLPL